MNEQGQTVSGGEAFACLWAVLPGFQRFSKIFQVRSALWILNLVYDLFLKIRPLLQTIVRASESNLFSKGFCRRLCGSPSKLSGKTEGD
jgi:hypothetical protein